jgi:hypothetical protein
MDAIVFDVRNILFLPYSRVASAGMPDDEYTSGI